MLQAHRLQTADPSKSYPDLKAALGAPKSCVPESAAAALGDAGWWLHGLKLAGAAARPSVLRQFPALAQGIRAEEAREAPAFGEYDGFVPAAGKVLDPCARERPASSTQLQKAAECPFRHFLEYGLGLQAVDEGERDSDVWLEPDVARHGAARPVRGDAGEDAVTRNANRISNRTGRGSVIGQTNRLEVLRHEMPPPSDEVFEREAHDFVADVELFLKAECEVEDGRTPIGFEVSFGRPLDDETQRAARAGGADRHRPREGPAVPPRRTNRSHRSDRSLVVRDHRLQDGRVFRAGLERDLFRRPSSSTCAVRDRGRGVVETEVSAADDRPRRLLLLEREGTAGAGADPSSIHRGDHCPSCPICRE